MKIDAIVAMMDNYKLSGVPSGIANSAQQSTAGFSKHGKIVINR